MAIVLDGLQGPLTEGQQDSLTTAKKACDHMVRQIDDILDSSRLETGKLQVTRALHPLDEVLGSAISQTRPLAEEKGLTLLLETPDPSPGVYCDDQRIVQVLLNLIGNAVKFTDPGGSIEVRATPLSEDGDVEISVRDTGRGISAEDLGRIFDRLYQTSHEDNALCEGMGIGLNLCRHLVALHGSEIRVQSEPDQGSTFTFTLPAREGALTVNDIKAAHP